MGGGGVPEVSAPTSRGFGTTLIERSLEANGGEADFRYGPDGVMCDIRLPLPGDLPQAIAVNCVQETDKYQRLSNGRVASSDLDGMRILLIEDEPLVAMELEAQLTSLGAEVIGPAGTVERARRLIVENSAHAALLDANLGGRPVDDLAAALTHKGIPFAFATGYGREALPREFQKAPVLSKPFDRTQLLAILQALLAQGAGSARIVSIGSKRM